MVGKFDKYGVIPVQVFDVFLFMYLGDIIVFSLQVFFEFGFAGFKKIWIIFRIYGRLCSELKACMMTDVSMSSRAKNIFFEYTMES